VEVAGEKATLYFLADEEERLIQGVRPSPGLAQAVERLEGVMQRWVIQTGRE
jgi:hypothetical protein